MNGPDDPGCGFDTAADPYENTYGCEMAHGWGYCNFPLQAVSDYFQSPLPRGFENLGGYMYKDFCAKTCGECGMPPFPDIAPNPDDDDALFTRMGMTNFLAQNGITNVSCAKCASPVALEYNMCMVADFCGTGHRATGFPPVEFACRASCAANNPKFHETGLLGWDGTKNWCARGASGPPILPRPGVLPRPDPEPRPPTAFTTRRAAYRDATDKILSLGYRSCEDRWESTDRWPFTGCADRPAPYEPQLVELVCPETCEEHYGAAKKLYHECAVEDPDPTWRDSVFNLTCGSWFGGCSGYEQPRKIAKLSSWNLEEARYMEAVDDGAHSDMTIHSCDDPRFNEKYIMYPAGYTGGCEVGGYLGRYYDPTYNAAGARMGAADWRVRIAGREPGHPFYGVAERPGQDFNTTGWVQYYTKATIDEVRAHCPKSCITEACVVCPAGCEAAHTKGGAYSARRLLFGSRPAMPVQCPEGCTPA